jgi:hypothetical protein
MGLGAPHLKTGQRSKLGTMDSESPLVFTGHTLYRMRRRQIPEEAVHAIVADADEVIERYDGRTEYSGTWEGRSLLVVIEDDGMTVVTVIDLDRGL